MKRRSPEEESSQSLLISLSPFFLPRINILYIKEPKMGTVYITQEDAFLGKVDERLSVKYQRDRLSRSVAVLRP
ncbi:MAG: hypothetical protein D6680_00235 [Cyanobacteria bacterium J007]|nr:MAG: hypothetical protein D6680_00235 [Cyanobacteria bacterium J007]